MSADPLADYIPEPDYVLFGCQPFVPRRTPDCPTCKGGVREGDDSTYCAACDSLSPRREAQVRKARIGVNARDQSEQSEQAATATLRKRTRRSKFTERERRLIWNGYGRGFDVPDPAPTNLARTGRTFLRSIGQEPDFSLVLDAHGLVVGRVLPHFPEATPTEVHADA